MHHLLNLILISFLSLVFALFPLQGEAANTPPNEREIHPSIEARVFKRSLNWDHLLEARWRPDQEGRFQSLGASTRRHLGNNYTVGIYAVHTWGERHFMDWAHTNGEFTWMDMDGHGEWNFGALAQKRWLLTELLSFDLRISFERHFNHKMDFIRIRPGVTWMAHPSWSIYFRYEAYHVLSPDTPTTFYRQGLYLGSLYADLMPLLLGPFIRYERQEWWTSPDFLEREQRSYRVHEELISVGLSIIYSF